MFGYSYRNYIFDFRSPNKFSPVWSKPWKSIPNNLDHLLQFRPDCKRCWRWLVTFSWRSLVHETNPARVQWKLVKKRREISADKLANPLQRVTVPTTYCIHFSTGLPTVIIMEDMGRGPGEHTQASSQDKLELIRSQVSQLWDYSSSNCLWHRILKKKNPNT